ncbi:MAG TPA: hypothetical protein VMV48_14825 [Gallionellaceae bacterium]|nr:hypothetical protein [Gallionellaceae bacterium]
MIEAIQSGAYLKKLPASGRLFDFARTNFTRIVEHEYDACMALFAQELAQQISHRNKP